MDYEISSAAMDVALFCRLNYHKKPKIPLRPSEMGILIYISISKESVCPLEISNFFGISKPSATEIIKRLIQNNYIDRAPSKVDGRSFTLSLTSKGQLLIGEATEEYSRRISILYEEMGSENFSKMIELIQYANSILKK